MTPANGALLYECVRCREMSRDRFFTCACDRSADPKDAEIRQLQARQNEMLDILEDVLYQACYDDTRGKGHMDSMALSANADGLRLLAKYGRVEIEAEYGRRVICRLKENRK